MQSTKNEVFHYGFIQEMWPNPQETADLVTYTEEIRMEKFIFCAVMIGTSVMKELIAYNCEKINGKN